MGTLGRGLAGIGLAGLAAFAIAPVPARGLVVDFRADDGASEVFFTKAGLKLKGSCESAATEVKALSTRTNQQAAVLRATSQSDILENGGSEHHYLGVDKFHSGSDGFQLLSVSAGGLAALDSGVGQLIQVDRRRVLAIDWLAESEGDALGKDCLFGGTGRTAEVGSARAILFRANEGSKQSTVFAHGSYKLRAECASSGGEPDLNLFAKSIGTSSTYIASHSDVNGNGIDEHGYSQAEALSDAKAQLDLSGVADDEAAGQIVINTSNPQTTIDWVASSSGTLGRDCLFAGILRTAGSGEDSQATYSTFLPEAVSEFHQRGGLALSAGCSAAPDLTMEAGSSIAGSTAHFGIQSDANGDGTDAHYYREADDLAPADVAVLSATEDENAIGQIVYAAPGGNYASVDFIADEEGIFGHADCAVAGVSDIAG